MKKTRILITGGSGFLGHRVLRLAQGRWDVTTTYLQNIPQAHSPGANPEVTWQRLDVRDESAVAALLQVVRPTVVVHTAAIHRGSDADLEAINAAGTRHVARAARATGARLIHLSTDALFDGEQGHYVEADPPSPITPYGRSKALAEEAVHAAAGKAVILRTCLIYDWRSHQGRQTRWMIDAMRAGKPVRLFTDELRCPIWVESLAAAVVELAGLDYTGVLHVAGAQSLSRYEFGLRLLRFHGLETASIIPESSRASGLSRPLNCTLDCTRARTLLTTPLPGVDEVLNEARM